MKGQSRLYCAGWAVWDVRLRVETFPPTSARTRVLERREDVGGPATVAALAAASLGTPAALIAHTGGDAGEKIRARLEALGGQAVLGATPNFNTPVYTVLVAPDGERFIFREALPEPTVPAGLPRLGAEDVRLPDCRAPNLALALARQAHDVGARVMLDFDRDETEAWQRAEQQPRRRRRSADRAPRRFCGAAFPFTKRRGRGCHPRSGGRAHRN